MLVAIELADVLEHHEGSSDCGVNSEWSRKALKMYEEAIKSE